MEYRGGDPPLPSQQYKLCRIVCQKRNGWTLRTFCQGSYSAICTPHWRNGYMTARCVSPHAEWVEKRMQETQCCVDATVRTRGKEGRPEADKDTRSFCLVRCEDPTSWERDWTTSEIWDVCRHHMT
mmetsp:Transcript_41916/g.125326  ORF Transcript_41916/g.125326 Transcript_41916/m.125326 type:complete len:126 (+) Transcript_41916:65-442(+)